MRPAVRGGTELAPFLASRGRAFPGGHCESVGLGGYLLQGGQGWNGRLWGWACENVLAIDAVTADGRLVHADETENADLYWAARGAGPGFPALVTRFYLRTYPKPPVMVQDTWTFPLDESRAAAGVAARDPAGLHRSVEPVVAATRLPGVPLDDGVRRPDGTVLLLHTTVMADSEAEVAERLAVFDAGPLAGRRLGHVRGLTTIAAENEAQTLQNPVGHRYVVDCTWSDAPAADLAPRAAPDLVRAADRALVLDLVRLGAVAAAAGHGVLGGGQRVPGHVRDLHRPGRRRAVRRLGARPDPRTWPGPGAACTWGTPTSSGGTTGSSPMTAYRRLGRGAGPLGPGRPLLLVPDRAGDAARSTSAKPDSAVLVRPVSTSVTALDVIAGPARRGG